MALIRILDRPIAFHRCLVTITGSINAALLLSQAIYWSNRTSNPEGWFHKSMEEWEDEAGLTRHEQSKARELLRKTGFWEERKAGSPPQVYYRINPEKFDRVIASFEEINLPKTGKSIYRKPANQFAENRQINLPKTGKSICRKPAVNLPETGKTSL